MIQKWTVNYPMEFTTRVHESRMSSSMFFIHSIYRKWLVPCGLHHVEIGLGCHGCRNYGANCKIAPLNLLNNCKVEVRIPVQQEGWRGNGKSNESNTWIKPIVLLPVCIWIKNNNSMHQTKNRSVDDTVKLIFERNKNGYTAVNGTFARNCTPKKNDQCFISKIGSKWFVHKFIHWIQTNII